MTTQSSSYRTMHCTDVQLSMNLQEILSDDFMAIIVNIQEYFCIWKMYMIDHHDRYCTQRAINYYK